MRRPLHVQDDAGNALRLISRTLFELPVCLAGELAQRQRDWCPSSEGARRAPGGRTLSEARSYGTDHRGRTVALALAAPVSVYDYLRSS